MRPVSEEFETTQEFGEGATAGVVANPDPDSGIAYYVWLYGNYQEYGHAGKDIGCPIGTPIHAPADGTVLYAGWAEDLPGTGPVRAWLLYYNFGGIITVIQHDGWISVIAHQSDNNAVQPGMSVKEGQLIGKSGNTKTRTTQVAPHVHIEALVYMDYRTDVSEGIIYGRVNPDAFFGTGAIAPQSGGTTIIKEWDEMASKQDIMDAVNAELKTRRTQQLIKDAVSSELGAVRTVKKLQTAIWTQVGGTRSGKLVSMWRDVVDTNTILRTVLATVQDIAKKGGTDVAALNADAVVDALAARLDNSAKGGE